MTGQILPAPRFRLSVFIGGLLGTAFVMLLATVAGYWWVLLLGVPFYLALISLRIRKPSRQRRMWLLCCFLCVLFGFPLIFNGIGFGYLFIGGLFGWAYLTGRKKDSVPSPGSPS
jgi:hypothetical protein